MTPREACQVAAGVKTQMRTWPVGLGKHLELYVAPGSDAVVPRLAIPPELEPGVVRWVKEQWRIDAIEPIVSFRDGEFMVVDTIPSEIVRGHGWRNAWSMPRWASRSTIVIKSTRAQRLHDIAQAEIEAEGLLNRNAFAAAWDRHHERALWVTNPWVWATEFELKGE